MPLTWLCAEDVVTLHQSVVQRERWLFGAKRTPCVGSWVDLKGSTFSTVAEAGETTQVKGFRPTNCALSALIIAGPEN